MHRKASHPVLGVVVEVLPELVSWPVRVGRGERAGEVGDTPVPRGPGRRGKRREGVAQVGIQLLDRKRKEALQEKAVIGPAAPRVRPSVAREVSPRDVVDALVLDDQIRLEGEDELSPCVPVVRRHRADAEVQDFDGESGETIPQPGFQKRGVGLSVGAAGHRGRAADACDPHRALRLGYVELPGAVAAGVHLDHEVLPTHLHLSLLLQDEVEVGDYVIVHAGFVIHKIDEEKAEASLKVLREAAARVGGGDSD